jgi:hypothetical protein
MRDTGKLFDRPRLCRPRIRTTQRYNIVDPAEVRPNVRTNRRDLLFTVKLQSLNPDGSGRVILTPPTNIQVQFDFEAGVGPRNIRYGRVNLECRWLLHLRRILAVYTGYYNELRTRLSLDKDSPAQRPIHRFGQLAAQPILGGLHHPYHQYCRI